jgi:ParB family chromosome partitioning protein
MEERGMTQDEIAKRVGKDRSTVANAMRILRLPKEVIDLLEKGRISRGHARCLVSLLTPEHQRVLAQRIVKEDLSVRQTEEIVGTLLQGKRKGKRLRALDPYVLDLERRLEIKLGTQVRIFHGKKNRGRIEIRYFSLDSLDRVLDSLSIQRS